MRRLLLSLTVALLGSWTLLADEPAPTTPASTAQEGQYLPGPFRVWAVNGERAQHFHDFFIQHDLNPVVAVIALQTPTKPQDPLAVLLQKLNGMAAARKDGKFGAFAIFLTLEKDYYDDTFRGKKVADVESLIKQLTLTEVSLGLSYPEAQPVKQFGIVTADDPVNMIKKHQVTVLVYKAHKVVKRFTYTEDKPLDEAGIKAIFAAAEGTLPTAAGK